MEKETDGKCEREKEGETEQGRWERQRQTNRVSETGRDIMKVSKREYRWKEAKRQIEREAEYKRGTTAVNNVQGVYMLASYSNAGIL